MEWGVLWAGMVVLAVTGLLGIVVTLLVGGVIRCVTWLIRR